MRATCESSLTPTSQLDRFLWRGGVAQLAEQRTHKPRVTRSIRVTATIYFPLNSSSLSVRCPTGGSEDSDLERKGILSKEKYEL